MLHLVRIFGVHIELLPVIHYAVNHFYPRDECLTAPICLFSC